MEEQLKVGQYTLIRKIGQGGIAEVWLAQHDLLGTYSAVKFLLPEFARNKDLQERFLNEGKRQATLNHPNIVQAMDFFQVEGRSFLVMKYIEGESLEDRLKRTDAPLSLEEIRSISSEVLSALEYAHSLGIIHRDVKPANMLMDKAGHTFLTDFGIAKVLREERSATQTGTSMGTPDYMSPEQIVQPKDVDVRSDVYSVGCVLYAMLSGNPPFGSEGETVFLVQDRHMRMPPPPLVYRNPKVPQTAEAVVFKCLEKDPAKRFQTCGEVLTALQSALSGKQMVPGPLPVPSGGGFAKYALAGLAAVILIAGLIYFLKPHQKDPRLVALMATDWPHVPYNYAFPDCLKYDPCLNRKTQSENLAKQKDWPSLRYDDPILNDCMTLQVCLDRKAQSQKLVAVRDWSTISSKSFLGDCMNYAPCEKRLVDIGPPPRPSCADIAENVPCCREYSDPAYCLSCKKRENVMGGDCGGIYQLPK